MEDFEFTPNTLALLAIVVIWDLAWKLAALWKAGRSNQFAWFIAIGLINSLGILPIIYLFLRRKKQP
jgi:hypothetical protein